MNETVGIDAASMLHWLRRPLALLIVFQVLCNYWRLVDRVSTNSTARKRNLYCNCFPYE